MLTIQRDDIMRSKKHVINLIIRKAIIFFRRPVVVYILISYLLLLATFFMEIRDSYKKNEKMMTYSYFDFIVNEETDDSVLMHTSPNCTK